MNPTNESMPRNGAYLARFRQRYGLTVAKMCALFGISTQAKYNELVKSSAKPEGEGLELDTTIALILRLYENHESVVPINTEFTIHDAFAMFQRTFGSDLVNESVIGLLFGRSAGSGYRWLNGSGNTTPQVGIILDRLRFMLSQGMEEPEVCYIWLSVVHQETKARGITVPLRHIDPIAALIQKYPLKYKHLAQNRHA